MAKNIQGNKGNLSLSKHRKVFGKTNRNPTNNLMLIRELEEEDKKRKDLIKRRKPKMFSSVIEAFKYKD